MDNYQRFIHVSRYAKWRDDLGRRESWPETVDRYLEFFSPRIPENVGGQTRAEIVEELRHAILNLEVLPSMRCMMTAGKALEKNNIAAYNCSYLAIDDVKAFSEIMMLNMSGTGVGFSVERQSINKLPEVAEEFHRTDTTIVVKDSRLGWCSSFHELITLLYAGQIPKWDLSLIREAGAKLKTFGGRASGPEPLDKLFKYCVRLFQNAAGRKLTSLEVHDLVCTISSCTIAGGVRRAALISLSNLSDDRMRSAKNGQWWETSPNRSYANNSAAYTERPEMEIFMREWLSLIESKSGERGIFNRSTAKRKAVKYGRRDPNFEFGTNPCFSGDTLVAVADGRGAVSFRELAEAGKDVLVYSKNQNGNPCVRWMRNPRMTGAGVDVYSLTLDDGTILDVTGNHEFPLVSGEIKTTLELQPGDALFAFERTCANQKEMTGSSKASSKSDYWWAKRGSKSVLEHRLIVPTVRGYGMGPREVVHHVDHNSLNNHPDNLEPMSPWEHSRIHKDHMEGDHNPMIRWFHGYASESEKQAYRDKMVLSCQGLLNGNSLDKTNEDLLNHAVTLILSLGRSFTNSEWCAFSEAQGLPTTFSTFRKELGDTPVHLGVRLAREQGLPYQELGMGFSRHFISNFEKFKQALAEGYKVTHPGPNCTFQVIRTCESCGSEIHTPYAQREICICPDCSEDYSKRKRTQAQDERVLELCKHYNDLRTSLGREPKWVEWETFRKEKHIKSSLYLSAIREAARSTNHRVVSVSYKGKMDVFNGTVDEYHNYYVGGQEGINEFGKPSRTFVCANNCGEISLRSAGFCNLTEVVIRPEDTKETLLKKMRIAAILGTLQSTLTDFKFLRKIWKKNAEEERLLGVSLTGICDNDLTANPSDELREFLNKGREYVNQINAVWAEAMDITPSVATTSIKPSGTVSQLVNSSSGIHPRYSKWYVRRVRCDLKDPLTRMLQDAGIPWEVDRVSSTTIVFSFPIESPESIFRNDKTAIEQLETYLCYSENWTEHNPSITVYVRDHEWLEVGAWVYKNFDKVNGVSFLPFSDHVYEQAPYEEITEEQYLRFKEAFPKDIDWEKLSDYEKEDHTTAMTELACVAGGCDLEALLKQS